MPHDSGVLHPDENCGNKQLKICHKLTRGCAAGHIISGHVAGSETYISISRKTNLYCTKAPALLCSMAGFPQQYGHQFQGSSSPAAGAPWNATAFPAPQHPRSAPSSYRFPPPGQPRDHAGVLRDAMVSNKRCDVPCSQEPINLCCF